MTDFYADPAVGGDGSHTTDDNDPNTGLGNGGFWTRLVPMFKNIVAIALNAKSSATAAASSATSAANAPGTNATTNMNTTIGLGNFTATLNQTGKLFSIGQTVVAAVTASPNNWMVGTITAFNSATGVMTVNVTNYQGSGNFTGWTISLSGAPGVTGVLNEFRSADVATAATVDLTNVTGNMVYLTGATSVTGFTLKQGASRTIVVSDGFTLKYDAAKIRIPGNADIACAANDVFTVRAYSDNNVYVTSYSRASGLPVKNPTVQSPGLVCLVDTLIASAAANVAFTLDATYDEYVIEVIDLVPVTSSNFLYIAMSTDGGATYATPLFWNLVTISETTTTPSGGGSASITTGAQSSGNMSDGSSGTIKIFNPGSSTKVTRYNGELVYNNGSNQGRALMCGHTSVTTPVNSVLLKFGSGNVAAGSQLKLYGVRKAVT